jgi:hypothetical protein
MMNSFLMKTHRLPDVISFDNDLGPDANDEVAPDGYACAKWLVYESGLDLRDLTFKVHSANPVAAEQIRGLLANYINHLKENSSPNLSQIRPGLVCAICFHTSLPKGRGTGWKTRLCLPGD